MKINVLDKGYVELININIGENTIAKIAGISYGKEAGVELIPKLLKLEHFGPFEMAQFIFKVKVPIFVDRHIVRHRTASRNEQSMRYTLADPDFYVPESGREMKEEIEVYYSQAYHEYERLLCLGMKKEQARMVLPLATYTTYYWKIDLSNLLNFFRQRLAPTTQMETRKYAEAMLQLIEKSFPYTAEFVKENYAS